ncbi:MAG: hypothetical protein MUC29_01395 [Pyrinomonadaceae bacterium]|jgi:hypothetical protein|nr:hypothetical protein [Pyrinomonadaceae bacterium]
MKSTPTKTMEYLNNVLVPWKEIAPDDVFSGMKSEQFEVEVKKSMDIRVVIANLEAELEHKKQERDAIDGNNKQMAMRIVDSVAGHQNHGRDSGLYKAMGFVPKSERKSGLTRKKKPANP